MRMGSEPPEAAVGAILAGGLGRRIGGAKPAVELDGTPLLDHVLRAVRAAALEPLVIAKPGTRLPPLECRTLREPEQPVHPACGIVAALRDSGGRPLVAVACDMPFLAPGLLAWLAARTDPLVLPELDGKLQPFPGRYDGSLLRPLEQALAEGRPLRRTLASLNPRRVGGERLARFGPPERLLFNVNTPADLRRAAQPASPPRPAPRAGER
jgi:molybdopterin-guanine dinucleotide biosynthesis protein A